MGSQFDLAIVEFDRSVGRQVKALKTTLGTTLFSGVVAGTPRDTQETSKSWLVSIDAPRTDQATSTLAEVLGIIKSAPLYSTIWIVNNKDHILVLEEGLFDPADPGPSKDRRLERFGKILVSGGYSTQAPSGIVAPVVKELEVIFGP